MANAISTQSRTAAQSNGGAIAQLNRMIVPSEKNELRKRFDDLLGVRAERFLRQVVSNVGKNSYLQNASPMSILGAAMMAATLNLDLSPSLGMAAIVPYGNGKTGKVDATFQVMVNGWVQLALRSGEYAGINTGFVYQDELANVNLLTGGLTLKDAPSDGGLRAKAKGGLTYREMKAEGVAGAFCWFRLINGFEKTVYWSLEDIDRHGRMYSKSYKQDLEFNKSASLWTTNFRAMAAKTVVKNAIVKWGPKSVDMYQAEWNEGHAVDEDGDTFELPDEFIKGADAEMVDVRMQDAPEDAEPSQPYDGQPGPESFEDSGDLLEGL